MALVFKDRVSVITTTVGTGSFALGSAVAGYQNFSVIGNGNTTYYTAQDNSGNWEVGIGTYSSTGPTLTRDTILESSTGGSAIDFGEGVKTVFVTYPAEKSVALNESGNVTALGTISSGTWQGTTLGVAYGGTNQTSYTNGQLLIGNSTGNTLSKATLTAGTGVSITNGSGSITIANTGLTSYPGAGLAVSTGSAWGTSKTSPTGDIVGTTDTQGLTNKTLTNPTVTNYVESVVAIGTVTSSNTLSLTNGTVQTATLTASTACTFTMPTAVAGKSFILLLKQAASTGNGTATFTGVKWGTSGTPTVTATAGKMDIFSFVSDGTNWYGSAAQGYTP